MSVNCWLLDKVKKGRENIEGRDHLEDILGRSYGSEPQVQTSLFLADAWLKRCNTSHAGCSQVKTKTRPPTRLIQVGSNSEHPKLCLTHPQDCEWAALSYCWGGHSDFTLTTARLKAFQRGMSYNKFPKTIRDAILVTRSLGIKFLWVDALCIIQDSAEDWGYESTKMCDVYKGAVITISASSSLKAAEGFLHQRKLQTNNCILPWKTPDPDDSQSAEDQKIVTKGTSLGFPPPRKFMPNMVSLRFFDEEEQRHIGIEKGPLAARGWVLQEELFSGRRLTFRGDQMVWECSTFQFCEGGFARHYLPNRYYDGNLWSEFKHLSTGRNRDGHLEAKHIHKVLDTWYDTIQQYSTRQLTRSTDRLPAISSLAKEFGRLKGDDTYCAGLWRSDIIKGLLWTPVYTKQIKRDLLGISPKERSPKKPYTGPSWSWASLDPWPLEIKHPKGCPDQPKNESESKYAARVLDITTQTSSSNSFGAVTNGSVTLEAPFCYIAGRQEEDDSGGKTSAVEKWIASSFKTEYTKGEWLHEFLVQHEGYPGQHFAAAILLEHGSLRYFLFLESVQSASQSEIQHYRRIGLVVQSYDKEDRDMSIHNWGLARKEVTIV